MWAGATTNVFPVIYGAILISLGLSWVQAAIIIAIGNLSYVLVGLASLTGPLAGTTTFTISRAAFGPNGNRGVGVLNWLMQLGFEVLGLASVVLAALVWWAFRRGWDMRSMPHGWARKAPLIPAEMLVDAVAGVAMVVGSLRAGTVAL